jgi:myo-inositol-1(or 4)-monophosphatase
VAHFDYNSADRDILAFLHHVADAAADTLDEIADWSMSGERDGQYSADVVIDDVVVAMLESAGFSVLSEESGVTDLQWPITDDSLLVVVDPLDGSTNASKGLPWYATSLCVVDRDGLRVALVADQSGSERRFSATRGGGAVCDGIRIHVGQVGSRAEAVIGTNGVPAVPHEWWQVRTMGAAALDISLVASGALDGYVDFHGHGVWDYLAAILICREAGALVEEAFGRDLLTTDPDERRQPLIASSSDVLASLRVAIDRHQG